MTSLILFNIKQTIKTKKQKFLKNTAFIFSKQWCLIPCFLCQVPKTVEAFQVHKYHLKKYINILLNFLI